MWNNLAPVILKCAFLWAGIKNFQVKQNKNITSIIVISSNGHLLFLFNHVVQKLFSMLQHLGGARIKWERFAVNSATLQLRSKRIGKRWHRIGKRWLLFIIRHLTNNTPYVLVGCTLDSPDFFLISILMGQAETTRICGVFSCTQPTDINHLDNIPGSLKEKLLTHWIPLLLPNQQCQTTEEIHQILYM